MLWKGTWMHKMRYFKTGDVFSIYAFFPLCFKGQNTSVLYDAIRQFV